MTGRRSPAPRFETKYLRIINGMGKDSASLPTANFAILCIAGAA